MLEQLSAAEALKWVLLVFAAGFIGFFGKYLGRVVMAVFQKKPQEGHMKNDPHDTSPAAEKDRAAKVAKKMMKASIKEQKKKSD